MSWTVGDTDQTIPGRFEAIARVQPDRPAIAGTAWAPTYAELDAAADRVAAAIGEGPDPVALLMAHDAPLFAAAIGALKAGRTVAALNPADPPARLAQLVDDLDAALVVTDAEHETQAPRRALVLDGAATPGIAHNGSLPAPRAGDPDEAAYVIFTSGSTGVPKGVVQTHRSMLHNVLRHSNGLEITAGDRLALLAPLSGGQGIGTSWTTLLNGATLCPFAVGERGLGGLADWIDEQAITVLPMSASVFRSFLRTAGRRRFDGVRLVRLGSEPAFTSDLDGFRAHFAPPCRLANTFSSSETGNITRGFFTTDSVLEGDRLPAGSPVDGIDVRLDGGEIVVTSDFLFAGYWGEELGRRSEYRTGDLGRWSADGRLTVLGRVDHQVKIHGFRVELGDVEAALAGVDGVASAAVAATRTARGDTKLTGFVVPSDGAPPTDATLRAALGAVLPSHAVPSAFVTVDALPLNPHGKVDRGALASARPAEGPAHRDAGEADRPAGARGPTEERVAALWAEALDRDRVPRDVGFLDLSGDSLDAAAVAAAMREAFGIELGLRAFAANPTVAELAEIVERGHVEDRPPPVVPLADGEPRPLSFAQERVWRSVHMPEGRLGQNTSTALRIRGDLDVRAFSAAIDGVFARHEILRTTVGAGEQVVHPPAPVPLPVEDADGADIRAVLAADAAVPFDLARGPLVRFRLLRAGPREHWLLRVSHHLITDGPSWRIFFDEIRVLYEGGTLPDLPVQYGDFAAWQRAWFDPAGLRYRREIAWWRDVLVPAHRPLALPPQRTTPPQGRQPPGVLWWGLEPELGRALDRLGRAAGATELMVRLAAFTALLGLETRREDLALGLYVSNRRGPELMPLFGDFTNLVTLRLRFEGEPTFEGWLRHVRDAVLEASEHVDIPYATVAEALAAEGHQVPELRAVFGRSHRLPPLRFGGLEIERLASPQQQTPTGFTFLLDRWDEAGSNLVYFDSHSYDPDAVAAFVERYRAFCAAASEHPGRALRRLYQVSTKRR